MTGKKAKETDIGGNFGAVAPKVNDIRCETGADKISVPPTCTGLEIGQKMKDGTVVIAVDVQKNIALFAPEGIFGGESVFTRQDAVVQKANEQGLAGHKDWRRVTEKEASALARDWNKVAPPALQGTDAPRFWGATAMRSFYGPSYLGGNPDWSSCHGTYSRAVPVVRSGPARSRVI